MEREELEKQIKSFETNPIAFIKIFMDRELSKKQELFLKSTLTSNHILNIWSRQTGKSTIMASYILWRLLYGKGMTVKGEHLNEQIAIVAPIKEQHVLIYNKIRTLIDKNEYVEQFILKINTEQILMKNGNFCKFMSASPGSHIRGFTATCIIIDESQDILDHKYNADILPFGATTNALICESGTPKTKNHFYRAMNNKAISLIKQPWFECPFLSKEYVMHQKSNSPDSLWRQEYLCLHPNTYIMGEIPKQIKDIKTGDLVYNKAGNLVKVKGVLKRGVNEECLKVRVWNGNSVLITKNHPVFTVINNKSHRYQMKIDIQMKRADRLWKGDYLVFPKLQEINNKITHKEDIPLTREILWLFGLWVAEGSIASKNRTVVFSMNSAEFKYLIEIKKIAKQYFNKDCTEQIKNKSGSSTQIRFNDVKICKFLIENFGKGAQNKKIPDWIYKLDKEQIKWFLTGYYDGDGHKSDKKFICCSISKKLIEGLNSLLLKFNIYSSIHQLRKENEKKIIMGREVTVRPKWQMQTYGLSYIRMNQLLNQTYILKKTSKIYPQKDFDLLLIKDIEKIQYKGLVYNIETETNTYLTEIGNVHNCEFVEEGVLAFPSWLFEPEMKDDKLTGRWNLDEYSIIKRKEELSKEYAIYIQKLLAEEDATFVAGLDLGKERDNTVYTILRTDIRPIKLMAKLKFPLKTPFVEIAEVIVMFYKVFQHYDFNIDYTNESSFIEILKDKGMAIYGDKYKSRGLIRFNNKNKGEMINTTRILLEQFQLQLPRNAETLISQFMNQQYEVNEQGQYKYFHPSGEHDDELWSLLLALKNITLHSIDEVTAFINPWEKKFDEIIHGPGKAKNTKELLLINKDKRMHTRYIPAHAKRMRA